MYLDSYCYTFLCQKFLRVWVFLIEHAKVVDWGALASFFAAGLFVDTCLELWSVHFIDYLQIILAGKMDQILHLI